MKESMLELKKLIVSEAEKVETALASYGQRPDEDLQILFDAEEYSLLGGGKRIRPFLVNEVCRMLGGDERASMPFACALEMIHTYSLIHDDLPCMDDDDLRRGKPTNHKRFGYANALLAGDALLTKAFFVASTNPHTDRATAAEAVALLSNAAGEIGMIGGQIMDLAGEHQKLSLEKLHRLHSMKTGALIRVAVQLGCLAAGYSTESREMAATVSYAEKIGLAFQVIDDILDATGSEEELGKSVGGDAEHEKTTFLSYYDVAGAKEYAARLTEDAISAISALENSEVLTDLAVYLLERNH